jgi:hypothetical protein
LDTTKNPFDSFSSKQFFFSQFYANSTISNYVVEFIKIADENAKQYDIENGLKTFTKEETEYAAKLYYKCKIF